MVRHFGELNWGNTLHSFWRLLFQEFSFLSCLSTKSEKCQWTRERAGDGGRWLWEGVWGWPICGALPLTWLSSTVMCALTLKRQPAFKTVWKYSFFRYISKVSHMIGFIRTQFLDTVPHCLFFKIRFCVVDGLLPLSFTWLFRFLNFWKLNKSSKTKQNKKSSER